MSVYAWSLSYDAVQVGAGPVDATWDQALQLGSIVLDITFVRGTVQRFGLQVDLWAHNFGGGPTYELVTVQKDGTATGVQPFNLGAPGVFVRGHTEANGQNGAAFLAAGSHVELQISVDDAAHTVTFSGPLGVFSYSFASLGMANGTVTGPALFGISLLLHPPKTTLAWKVQADFFNFYLSQDGVRVAGAQLGSFDPGVWSTAPWASGTLGIGTGATYSTQTTTRQGGGRAYDPATDTYGTETITAVWNPAGTPQLKDTELLIDLLCDPVSSFLVYARVRKQTPDQVTVGYSSDQGHTWTEVLITPNGAGPYCTSPSLQAHPRGLLSLVFYDGFEAQQWFSASGGQTWYFGGIYFPAFAWLRTTTHPRHFVTEGGLNVLTYNSGGHVRAQTFDGTISGLGLGVTDLGASGGTGDEYPAIVASARNILYVVWVNAASGAHQWHSENMGVGIGSYQTDPVTHFHDDRLRPDIVYRPTVGVAWVLYQAASGDLIAYSSDNLPEFQYRDPAASIIIQAAAAAQYAAIDVLPRSIPIMVYQEKDALFDSFHVNTRYSPDGGATWTTP